MPQPLPILYSFRRCPYAMRARLALEVSEQGWEHREVDLRARPAELRAVSSKASVPVLVLPGGQVLDESLEIMLWTLARADPEGWLQAGTQLELSLELIARCDTEFKGHLDRYKYADRHPGAQPELERDLASAFLMELEQRLTDAPFLFGPRARLADMAIFPFVRQFAGTDREWFESQPWRQLMNWLEALSDSPSFAKIMCKFDTWTPGAAPVLVS